MVLQKLWNILRGKTRKPKGSLGNINSFCPPLRFCIGQAKGMMSEMTLLVGGIAEMTFPSMLWRGDNMPMNKAPWCVVYVVIVACECLTDHLFSRCGSGGRCRNCKCLFDLRALEELRKGSSPTGFRTGVLRKGPFCNRPM